MTHGAHWIFTQGTTHGSHGKNLVNHRRGRSTQGALRVAPAVRDRTTLDQPGRRRSVGLPDALSPAAVGAGGLLPVGNSR